MKKRHSRIIAAVIASAMITCTIPAFPDSFPHAPALTACADGDFLYEKTYSGCICITGYTGTAKTVTIPAEMDGSPVVEIGESAFEDNTSITSVILPETLEKIEDSAFSGCSGITGIKLPEGLTSLDKYAFSHTGIREITLPASLKTCNYPFIGCKELKKVTFAEGTEKVPASALEDTIALETVVFPDTVTYIGPKAFRGCRSLKEITLPPALEQLAGFAFTDTAITEITIPASLRAFQSDDGPFEGCDTLKKVTFEDGMETIPAKVMKGAHCLTDAVLPDSVTGIGEKAFENCASLKEFPFREGLTSLGAEAFAGTAITELNFPLSLAENISGSRSAFSGCDNLRKVTFADGTTRIPSGCMEGAAGLSEVVMPESVWMIGESAFANSGLKHIDLHEGITQLSTGAFSGSALREVTLPSTLTVTNAPFNRCSKLKKAVFSEGTEEIPSLCLSGAESVEEVVLPGSLKKILSGAFNGTTSLKSITLPEGLESIGISAFEESGLTDIVIPDSVSSISVSAFEKCIDLQTAALGKGEVNLGSSLFRNCTSLKKFTIPDEGIRSVGSGTFSGCRSLTEVEYSGEPLTLKENSFSGCYALQDERFVRLVHPATKLTPTVNSTVNGNKAEFTVSFEVPEELGTEGSLHELILTIPRDAELIKESMTVDSGTLSSKSDPEKLSGSIYFTSRSGSVTFSVKCDSKADIEISAELKVKIDGYSSTLPVGVASLTSDELTLRVPGRTDSLSNTISGTGPRGKKVDILMDGKVIASPECDPANGAFSFEAALPEGTENGTSFMLCARYDETTTEEAPLVYRTDAPVVKSVKMHTADPGSDIDLTGSFTDGTIHFVPLLSSSDVRFTIDVTDPEEISQVAVIYTRPGTSPDKFKAKYDSESGLWIADCDMGSYSYGEVYGINIAVLTKEDKDAGKKLDAENCFYSSPAGLRLFTYATGWAYEGAPSNRVPYGEFTLYKVNDDGTQTLWEANGYVQNNPFKGDRNGCCAWGFPEDGKWNIVCKAEGYEPAESGVFRVGESFLNLNKGIGFVSPDPGEVKDVVYDEDKNCLVLTFGKYMIPGTVTGAVCTGGAENIWTEPAFHNDNEDVTDTFLIHGSFNDGDKVNVKVGTGCLTYAEVENTKEFEKTVTIGEKLPPEIPVETPTEPPVTPEPDDPFAGIDFDDSPVRVITDVSRQVLGQTFAGDTVTVYLSLSGGNNKYSSFGIHLRFDERLELVYNEKGEPAIEKNPMSEESSVFTCRKYEDPDPDWEEWVISFADSGNTGKDGALAVLTFRIPDDVEPGDIYPLDLIYRPGSSFTSQFSPEEEVKQMEAYFFKEGIYNENNRNQFWLDDDTRNARGLRDFPGDYDGYIAIADLAEIIDVSTTTAAATAAAKPVTTTTTAATSAAPTDTTAKSTASTAKPATTPAATGTAAVTTDVTATEPVLIGDINGDNIVDANDASELLSLYAQISTGGSVSEETKAVGDVNRDGLLDSADASLILEYYALASTSEGLSAAEFFKGKQTE